MITNIFLSVRSRGITHERSACVSLEYTKEGLIIVNKCVCLSISMENLVISNLAIFANRPGIITK